MVKAPKRKAASEVTEQPNPCGARGRPGHILRPESGGIIATRVPHEQATCERRQSPGWDVPRPSLPRVPIQSVNTAREYNYVV